MKKLLCLLLALLMIASVALVACGDKDEDPVDTDEDFDFIPSQNTGTGTGSDTTKTEEPASYTFEDVDQTVYIQNCVQANVRSTPSASNKNNIVASVDFGAQYKRVKYNEVWSGIEVDGEILYINTYFLTTKADEVVFEMKEGTPAVLYVTNIDPNTGDVGNLYLRTFTSTTPDSDFHPLGNVGAVAKHGAKLNVTGISADGHWYRVDFDTTDTNGQPKTIKNLYVYNGRYVTETNPVA